MRTPEPEEAGRVLRPVPSDEHGWLRLILDLLPFPSLVVETDGARVILGNEAARAVPLLPPPGADDPDAYYVIDAEGSHIGAGRLTQHLAGLESGPEGTEILWHTPTREFFFRVFTRALVPSDGRISLSVLSFMDVTRQRVAEEELRLALELRDEFFSIATHELKDPLFSLQLSVQLLRHTAAKQGEVPAYLLHHMEVSQRQTERLTRLVDNLLDVSRIMNRRLQLDVEALDACEIAREMVGRLQERARSAGSQLDIECSEPVLGYFDRMKLEQVIGNLLSNAIKYGAGKPITVRVRGEGEMAVLEVEDRGVGIAPEDQGRIFGRFERASDRHKKESLGLGLYIVRSLVEAHGGTIHVRSEPGKGSTFLVNLPKNRFPTGEGSAEGTDRPA